MDLLVDSVSDGILYLLSLPKFSLISAAVVLVILRYWQVWDRSKYPPAPIPLPFLGDSLLFFKDWHNPARYFYENRHKHGEVFTLRLNVPTVFLNSPEAVHEGFVKNANSLSSRPPTDIYPSELVVLGHENALGLFDSPDGVWQQLRRHMFTVFREHGVGKQGMEEVITTETRFFLEALEKSNGDPIDVQDQLTQSISNVATHIIFGRRFDYDAEQLANLQVGEFYGAHFAIELMPLLQYLPFDPIGYEASKVKIRAGLEFCLSQIAEHKADLDPDNPRDLVDSFLIEISKAESDNQAFTDANLLGLVVQLYLAGTDTTSNSLYWAFLYMILHPDVQERISDEIQCVIGERPAVNADKDKMPFTMSTITEVLRTDVATMSIAHYTSEETVVRGHTIPKGTAVFGNLWSVTHNEDIYKDPHQFKADRFLDQEGNFVKPDVKEFMAFSIGRRVCPGEQLARTELFLFLVSTLQKFKIECGQDTTPSTEAVAKAVLEPPKYKVKFIPRS